MVLGLQEHPAGLTLQHIHGQERVHDADRHGGLNHHDMDGILAGKANMLTRGQGLSGNHGRDRDMDGIARLGRLDQFADNGIAHGFSLSTQLVSAKFV
jgi:hypothetical protein